MRTIIESQRIRTTKSTENIRKDRIADRGPVSMSHHNMHGARIDSHTESNEHSSSKNCNGHRLGQMENEAFICVVSVGHVGWRDDASCLSSKEKSVATTQNVTDQTGVTS